MNFETTFVIWLGLIFLGIYKTILSEIFSEVCMIYSNDGFMSSMSKYEPTFYSGPLHGGDKNTTSNFSFI